MGAGAQPVITLFMNRIIKANSKQEQLIEENCFITEMINQADMPAFSLSKARVLPGVTTENHLVRETDEVYYLLSGEGEMEIDGVMVGDVSAGDVVFIPANSSQRIRNAGKGDLVFLCICTPRFEFGNYASLK
jgi:mannose-6-phosphate isomerase-like protein (cupin superfamily)